jgi:ABC-2 type transport system ATP-binding protein
MDQQSQDDRGGSGRREADDAGTDRRSFLKGATSTLLAAGALGTSVTNAAADGDGYHTTTRRIETWDGKELATRLYVPGGGNDDGGPYPAVLITHGYGSDKEGGIPARMGALYARHGYAVLTYDSRGFGESDGEVGVDGPKEVKDAQALLDWLGAATQDVVGRDGADTLVARDGDGGIRVGMDGLSYAGGIQLNLAAVDDRLDAIVPRWAWNDLVYSLAPNGGIKAAWTTILQEFGFQGSRDIETNRSDLENDARPEGRDVRNGVDPRLYEFYAESAATNEFSPAARAFFKLRSPSTKGEGLAENAPPSLLVTGWNDTLFTATETVRNHALLSEAADSRMVFIRGGHSLEQQAPLEQGEIDRMALAWMDEHVAGRGPANLPEVTYWHAQDGRFKSADGLPDAASGPSRSLASASNAGPGTTTLAGGPAPGSNSQVLVQRQGDYAPGTAADFDFVADEATQVLGIPRLTLRATPLGRDPLVFAKLYHVTGSGTELIYNQATPYQLEGPVGEPQTVAFDLAGIERRIGAGEALRLTLATTDAAFFNSRTSAGVRIDHGATELAVPVERGDGLAAGPAVSVSRSDDGDVFTAGATNQVDLTVHADRPVFVRDRTPAGWSVVGGDPHSRPAPPETDGNLVEFDAAVADGTLTYFAEAPSGAGASGRDTFGPVEYSLDGETWTTLSGTTDENVVVVASTNGSF